MAKCVLKSWIAGALLLLATILTWNNRFEISDHPLNATVIDQDYLETLPPENRSHCSLTETDQGLVVHIERMHKEGIPALPVTLRDLEVVRFISISCDYRWQNVVPGEKSWMTAQGVLSDKMEDGSSRQPSDFGLFDGSGTQAWTNLAVVRELNGPVTQTHFYFSARGKSGSLDLRNLRFAKVAQRSWIPFTTILISLGWLILIIRLLRKCQIHSPIRVASACLLIAPALWLGVFPTTNTLLIPLTGSFPLDLPHISKDPAPEQKELISQAPPLTIVPSRPENTIPAKTLPEQKMPDERTTSSSPSIKENTSLRSKNKGIAASLLRKLMVGLAWFHFPIFFILTWMWFLITRETRSWPF
ncbi:hypothetical protein N9E90_04360, partial [Akkermansiaceae bacterium]|nr:hypothetical protein [Akkermansiaceae bacterium]